MLMKPCSIAPAAGLALALSCTAWAQVARTPVQDFKPLMVQAIDARDGTAHGVLVGEMASAITKQLQATGPILIDVSTLRRYKQAGCSRLNVRFSQEGVLLPGETEHRAKWMDVGINYCRDGSAPRSLS